MLSAVTMIPHLAHAVRTRKPSGSPLAWTLGAVCSTVWFVYGVADRDLLVAAPGLVTIPIGVVLAAWAHRERVAAQLQPPMVIVPAWEPPVEGYRAGDTLEMPRVVA
ncbi:hypothetical protein ACT8ZV_18250 [Nocardioides sp. MAHUQ-72]|uniref:hypothetical protein n=1 Tax=unclassified Nocardioides TaxID=2615069 RepID=UPI003611DA97